MDQPKPAPHQGGGVGTMEIRLLTRQEVQERCGLSCSTIYRMMREKPPGFPLPIKVSPRKVRWIESEFNDWLASRPRAIGDFPG